MTPEAQRIAIAQACGWKTPGSPEVKERTKNWVTRDTQAHFIKPSGDSCGVAALPSYLTDLNAMHEAEEVLRDADQKHKYASLIGRHDYWTLIHSPAAIRAECFLRTLNLWTDK